MLTNLFYRIFKEFKDALAEDGSCAVLCDSIIHADEADKMMCVMPVLTVDEDWIAAIERGLVFVGKAIDEERQFIRSNGSIEQIEKVKHVSRETVEHLARHSDLITKQREDGEVMPEKLYTVERLNDYTVYENKFLYLLLNRLKDFIALRYNQMIKIADTYKGELTINKTVSFGKRKLRYTVMLNDERENDVYMRRRSAIAPILTRLERLQREVAYYLKTPLMVEVSKVDKIKSKITKTNVLMMDKNFKEALALYEYLLAYDKPGFTVENEEQYVAPKEYVARELAYNALLTAFLTYEHTLGIEDELAADYAEEEKLRLEEEKRKRAEQIKNLQKRVKATGQGIEEYVLLLEEQIKALEKDSAELVLAKEEIVKLGDNIDALNKDIEAKKEEMALMKERHAQELEEYDNRLKEVQRKQLEEAAQHAEALVQLENSKREELEKIRTECDEKINLNIAECDEKIEKINADCETKVAELTALAEEKRLAAEESDKRAEEADAARRISDARLLAMRNQHGLMTELDDYTSETAFNELEEQFEALGKLVRSEWKGAKKMMRSEYLRGVKEAIFGKRQKKQKEISNEDERDERDVSSGSDGEVS